MVRLDFTKMNGAGNDFVMLDNRTGSLCLTPSQIERLCNRHHGVGADGVLILEKGIDQTLPDQAIPIRMRYYNADGYEVDMCGNGARCFTRYAAQLLEKETGFVTFQTEAGTIIGELLGDQVTIAMSQPHALQLHKELSIKSQTYSLHSINTGVPHLVLFVDHLEEAPVVPLGRALRHHSDFAPAGTNVNFVKVISSNELAIRTYERGVEEETLACGTGVVASALIYHLLSKSTESISVKVRGGDTLYVNFKAIASPQETLASLSEITLTGPASFVFTGTILI